MFSLFTWKKKEVPQTNETKVIEVVQTWEVRWKSRRGEYFSDTREEVEVFTSEEKAKDFRDSLVNAFKLLKHTSGNSVSLEKSK